MRLGVADIVECTGGAVVMEPSPLLRDVCGISWDSRTICKDDLYVAFPGERVDGHDYCGHAIRSGAACVLVEKAIDADTIDSARFSGAAVVRVPNTMQAVVDLAAFWRTQLSAKVVAITGSSGKTTTKDLVKTVLSSGLSVVATQANQNNELGVPATLLRASTDTQAVVVEMGMRGLNQIESLCSFVQPDMALVTNVGESHIELLGSRDAIAHAKAEALAAVPADGCVFVNASDDFARELLAYGKVREKGAEAVLYDGSGVDPLTYPADLCPSVFAADVVLDEAGCPSFTLCTPAGSVFCKLALRGAHNVHNAVAAAAVACSFGIEPERIAHALEAAQSSEGRQNVFVTLRGVTVVDDAYNANPASMRASLRMFAAMKTEGKRWAVLGDMGELGAHSRRAHAEAGEQAAEIGLDRLVCVGPLSQTMAEGARRAGMPASAIEHVPDAAAALALLEGALDSGDAVLVKASHATHLDIVVKGLAASC